MRATLLLFITLCASPSWAQAPLDVGSPESAFSGGPLRLSKNAAGMLRAHYQGEKVPLVPQPFRGRLDTAFVTRDWPKVEAVKKDLIAKDGIVAALAWEQSRFIATGSIGIAELHALDVAATGSTGLSETAVMLWFYSVAVTMTDGHKCVDEAAKDAHLDKLRGPAFEPVTRIVRTISDDRLAAMRDLAIRLETVLAVDRNDDTMCRTGAGAPGIKPDAAWRPEASLTRGMLSRHLTALASVMRPLPIARPEQPKPEMVKPVVAPPPPVTIVSVLPPMVLALPVPFEPSVPAPPPGLSEPAKAALSEAANPPETSKEAALPVKAPKIDPPSAELVNPSAGKPDPTRFEPPKLELAAPDPQAKQ